MHLSPSLAPSASTAPLSSLPLSKSPQPDRQVTAISIATAKKIDLATASSLSFSIFRYRFIHPCCRSK
jgi:hypothetical protein